MTLARRLSPYLSDEDLFVQALSHRSWCAEHAGGRSNERLEFLGDAVLGIVVTERLYLAAPEASEGDLARSRSRIVSEVALAPVAAALGVGEALRLGRGEESSGGREKPSLLADALEALIGACYLERGLGAAQSLVDALLGDRIAEVLSDPGSGDHKGRLQELATRLALEPPRYEVRESGPDHAKRFFAEVFAGDELLGTGHGRSKKNAELEAADQAVALLSSRFGGA